MIKEHLQVFLGAKTGPPKFADFGRLLSAPVLRFPDEARISPDPNGFYGAGWDTTFRLPQSPIGIEDSQSLIVLEDTKPNAVGLDVERKFLFVQPLEGMIPEPLLSALPMRFYLAWGTCSLKFSTMPPRIDLSMTRKGEWFVCDPKGKYADIYEIPFGVQHNPLQGQCESLMGPGVRTAFEQLVYLTNMST